MSKHLPPVSTSVAFRDDQWWPVSLTDEAQTTIRAKCGLPSEIELACLSFEAEPYGEQWKSYRLTVVSSRYDAETRGLSVPTFTLVGHTALYAWLTRVTHPGFPVALERRFILDQRGPLEEMVIDGIEKQHTQKQLLTIDAARPLLGIIDNSVGSTGRHAGSYDIESADEYARLIHEQIYAQPSRLRWLADAKTATIACWLGISESSIDRYKPRFGIGIRDIRRKRVPKPN